MPDIFDTSGVDLDHYLGTRNSTNGALVQDKDLINHIKAILGPFVLRRVKSDVMKQLVAKTHEVHYTLISHVEPTKYNNHIFWSYLTHEILEIVDASSHSLNTGNSMFLLCWHEGRIIVAVNCGVNLSFHFFSLSVQINSVSSSSCLLSLLVFPA